MKIRDEDKIVFNYILDDLLHDEEVLRMKNFIQHGDLTPYDHAVNVAWTSLKISRYLGLKVDERSLLRGALLHDFYLYDWHDKNVDRKRFHGFHHPLTAFNNAKKNYTVNKVEEDIILKHMWPLTLKFPKYRESYVVTLADKICSFRDTLGIENEKKKITHENESD